MEETSLPQSNTVQSMLYVTLCTSCTDYNTHLFSCLISQKTYGPIMIPTTVMKSVPWRNLESALAFCKLQKTTWYWGVISNLPLLSVKHVCLISQKTYGPILIPKNRDVYILPLLWEMSSIQWCHWVLWRASRLHIVPIRYLWQPFCTWPLCILFRGNVGTGLNVLYIHLTTAIPSGDTTETQWLSAMIIEGYRLHSAYQILMTANLYMSNIAIHEQ